MSDINNNLDGQNQDQTNDNSLDQNNQYKQAEEGSTYWESEQLQGSFDVQAAETNTTDNIQSTEDLTYEEFKNKQYELEQKKKSKKPILALLLTLVILFATAATAYAFSDTVRNSIDMLIKNPKDYYAHIENKSLGSSVDKSIAYMNMSKDKKNLATDVTAKLSYDKDTVGAMLQGFAGMSISDIEALIGISLDSIGFDIVSAAEDKTSYQKIGINLNDTPLITGEMFIDQAEKEILFFLPELSSAYLRQSLDMSDYGMDDIDLDGFVELTDKLSSESTGEFIKRYAKIITGGIDDVKLTKKEQLTVGDLTVEANLLTVTINPEDLMNILAKVLEEAKNDEYILDLLPTFDVTKDEYLEAIDKAIAEVQSSLDDLTENEELINMLLYVGKDGSILGRKIKLIGDSDEIVNINYFNLEDNNKGTYELYIDEESDNSVIQVTGSHTKENGAYTGSGKFKVDSYESGPAEIDFEYNGIKSVVKNNRVYLEGNINISSYEMMGMEIALEFGVKDQEQLFTIKLNMGKASLVTLESSTKYLDDFTMPKPDSNADIYDLTTEAEAYALTVDIQSYISALSDRLGVDLNNLLGLFMPAY